MSLSFEYTPWKVNAQKGSDNLDYYVNYLLPKARYEMQINQLFQIISDIYAKNDDHVNALIYARRIGSDELRAYQIRRLAYLYKEVEQQKDSIEQLSINHPLLNAPRNLLEVQGLKEKDVLDYKAFINLKNAKANIGKFVKATELNKGDVFYKYREYTGMFGYTGELSKCRIIDIDKSTELSPKLSYVYKSLFFFRTYGYTLDYVW